MDQEGKYFPANKSLIISNEILIDSIEKTLAKHMILSLDKSYPFKYQFYIFYIAMVNIDSEMHS